MEKNKEERLTEKRPSAFWSMPAAKVLEQLRTGSGGLTEEEARRRLEVYGPNHVSERRKSSTLRLFVAQFTSPIILILLFATGLSLFVGDVTGAAIILVIVFIGGVLGFWQERGAANALERLLSLVQVKVRVVRDGKSRDVAIEKVVPGDIVTLSAGDIIPSDCLILESRDLFVDEATLTGETYPVEKLAEVQDANLTLSQRKNVLFMGTHLVSGTASAAVVYTGKDTEFGKVSEQLKLRPPETEFVRGVRRFGYLLMEVTLVLVIVIFATNVYFSRPVLDSFLFALALAVGLIPQLLPAIISVNLAHGANRMCAKKVIVRRLTSIENFGSMNVLCSDKTGTLTEGKVRLKGAFDADGSESEKVLLYAYLNASYQTGFANPIDEAIRCHGEFDISGYEKLDEIPYDFHRKRLSILARKGDLNVMITKGALMNVLEVCSAADTAYGGAVHIARMKPQILKEYEELSNAGFRVLGVSFREMGSATTIGKDDESDMTFVGFLALCDSLKPGIKETVQDLRKLGIGLKIITGDNALVAASIAREMGEPDRTMITGSELRKMSDEALMKRVNETAIFTEIEPNQKERIINALKKSGNVVGCMGDGINDASALHAADVSISVDSAVDVAKEAADIVLLEKDLEVLVDGVEEGRKTFANTLKYVFMATSANFGNMFSMAGASLFMSFLPLLPEQILFMNLLTDLPEMAMTTDSVDRELVEKPRRWNIKFIRNFMITFGAISSIFDYVTFVVLLLLMQATEPQFRTGWFIESVISAAFIVLIIRTRRPFFRSRPGAYLLLATILVIGFVLVLPYTPLGEVLGFSQPPLAFFAAIGIIIVFYLAMAELAKIVFYAKAMY